MRLLFVSNRLPVTAIKKENGFDFKPSVGGLATGLNAYLNSPNNTSFKKEDNIWIGWPGINVPDDQQNILKKSMLKELNQLPVFLTEEAMDNFYLGFCNKTIWPLFHYFPTYTVYKPEFWEEYKQVNEVFLQSVLEVMHEDDVLWIHDYHLLLLPHLVRQHFPKAKIGFFLHIPFPAYDMFRLLPKTWRNEILQGLLGADLVGFHTHEYAQYFERCVLRILGYENQYGGIRYHNRIVKSESFPMNIDFDSFYNTALKDSTLKDKIELKQNLGDRKMILSIDRLDYSKGILHRLKAFELFLEKYPDWQDKVVLVLVVVPSRVQVEMYHKMKRQIDEHVGHINGKFGTLTWSPILYQYKALGFEDLTALYSACEIALITPLRDGMNLIAKEFLASKTDQKGVLILSEMAGATQELQEAIIINPNDNDEIATSIHIALSMPEEEQIKRNKALQTRLRRYNVVTWADEFLNNLTITSKEHEKLKTKLFSKELSEEFISDFKSAKKRLLLMDYDGTLVSFAKRPELAKPTDHLLEVMKKITSDKNTTVVIVSGRDRHSLDNWFKNIDVQFAAEHGVWIKERNAEWRMLKHISNDWKPSVINILNKYTDRLPGTFVEEKEYAVVWHYRNADPELAKQRAIEVIDELVLFTSNSDAQILQGNKIVEIRAAGVNKGNAALHWMNMDNFDFIAGFGDDHTDEDMFKALPETTYSIKVGQGKTSAKYNVTDNSAILQLLDELAEL